MNQLSLPYTLINPNGSSDWLLVCEHASNHVPARLKHLGLGKEHFDEHIAYDIGTYEMTKRLSEQLDATAILCNYSRLVIDCNRPINAPDCIPQKIDGTIIPSNINITEHERLARITEIYQPFHACISSTLTEKLAKNKEMKFANIHSFTPMLKTEGTPRPWEIGFIYRDPKPTQAIIAHISQNSHYVVGDNQPYNGVTHKGYTIPAHADAQAIPSVLVEFRQDLINTPSGVAHWAEVFSQSLRVA